MKLTFPNEEQVIERLNQQLADRFDYAKRLLRFWMEDDLDTGFAASNLPLIVLRVALAMSVRACRQFRSVIELCERGEAVDASIIARSMFETALVVGYVLKPRFTPHRYDGTGKVKSTIIVPGVRLTREFRATLFVAHHVFQPERSAARHISRPGMARHAKCLATWAGKDEAVQAYKKEIGPKWTEILMNRPFTYSGLNISDLARNLGKPLPKWYDVVYSLQSEHVHPADLQHHMQIDDKGTTMPDWHESPEHVCRGLLAGISMFYTIIGIMNRYVGFGIVMNTALDAFHREHERLIEAE
jgi:hypothetical protein